MRTIRYYDKQGILKPSHMSESGYRLYTDGDFAKLQKILTLKYLGFSLDEIQEISMNDSDQDYVRRSLELQLGLVKKKIESLLMVEESLTEASRIIGRTGEVDWKTILHLIHLIDMEKSLAEQYKTGANTSVRIRLHQDYSVNPEGWFRWLYCQLDLQSGMKLLELGAGNGELWAENLERLAEWKEAENPEQSAEWNRTENPEQAESAAGVICLSDISAGMIQDARERLGKQGMRCSKDMEALFSYRVFDCHQIPFPESSYDRVTANHVLFYLKDLDQALSEVRRVLKPEGCFICSTYGERHMHEISDLAEGFDERISLSEVPLSDVFGLENGEEILRRYFSRVELVRYEDELVVTEAQPIIDYILSCHGNQRDYIQGRYEEFKAYIQKKLEKKKAFRITKDAGVFRCRR